MAALGRRLMRRGHRVTVFQVPPVAERVRAAGLDFYPLGPPSAELSDLIDRMGRLTGLASLRFAVNGAVRLADIICLHAPEALAKQAVDLLLVDQNEPAGGTVGEHLGLPFLNVAPSLPLNREPGVPPPFVPWNYSATTAARLRNRIGYALADRLIAPINRKLNQFRRTWGLTRVNSPNDSFSRLGQLCQMPREFDFPREQLPANFHYLGPFLEENTAPNALSAGFPFERLNGRPLIYASFGTLQSGAMTYFERIAQACNGLNAQLVIATGQVGQEVPAFPGETIAVGYAPQLELLSRAALTVTHAGLNTTMQSLYFGVPMVAIPMTHDQPAIAARVGWTGSGVVVPPNRTSVERLRKAIETVLSEPAYRAAARRLKEAIGRSGGVERAADIVEQHLGKGKN